MLLATWFFAPPQAGEKDERRFEKRNLFNLVSRLRFHVSVVWSRAKSLTVLGGTLGENEAWCSGHGSSSQADGCGLSPAVGPSLHVVLCGHRSVFSSPPGRRNVSPPCIFSANPLVQCQPPLHAGRGEYSGRVLLSEVLPLLREAQTPAQMADGRKDATSCAEHGQDDRREWRCRLRRSGADLRATREARAAQTATSSWIPDGFPETAHSVHTQRSRVEETDSIPATDQRSRAQPPTQTAPAPRTLASGPPSPFH